MAYTGSAAVFWFPTNERNSMRGMNSRRLSLIAALSLAFSLPLCAADSEIVSSMRTVSAVAEAHGYRLNPAYDSAQPAGPEDLAPPQAFEVIRPDLGRPVTIGRLYTSCSCIQLESPKRTFAAGERAILQLRNIKPTPTNGQVYAVYVQVTSPIRATLRFDTFMQSQSPLMVAADPTASSSSSSSSPAAGGMEVVQLAKPATDLVALAAEANAAEGSKTAETAAAKDATDAKEATEKKDDAPAAAPDAQAAAVAKEEDREPIPSLEAAKAEMDALFAKNAGETGGVAELPAVPGAAPDGFGQTLPDAPAASKSPTLAEQPAASPAAPAAAPENASANVSAPAAAVAAPTSAPAPAPASVPVAAPVAASTLSAAAPAAAGETRPFQTVTLITIGVNNMARAIAFYEELGWRRAARNKYDQTAFFQLNGQVLALYPLTDLVKEQNMGDAKPVAGGVTLGLHVPEKADVVELYRKFIAAGGRSLREPTEMPSGAVTSYVADPDGNPWEISWVPQFRLDAEGGLWLP